MPSAAVNPNDAAWTAVARVIESPDAGPPNALTNGPARLAKGWLLWLARGWCRWSSSASSWSWRWPAPWWPAVVPVISAGGRASREGGASAARGPRRGASGAGGRGCAGGRVIVLLKQKNADISLARGLASGERWTPPSRPRSWRTSSGSGGSRIRKLTLVNAVAADRVGEGGHGGSSKLSSVAQVVPDQTVTETVPITKTSASNVAAPAQQECPTDPGQPLVEPEALQTCTSRARAPTRPTRSPTERA